MNNAEGVFLQGLTGSNVTIRVAAANINSDGVPNHGDGTDQDFALTCYNCAFVPDFALTATPAVLDLCAPADAAYVIGAEQLAGYAEPITLSVVDVPAGASAGFDTNPVAPGGSSTLTITDTTPKISKQVVEFLRDPSDEPGTLNGLTTRQREILQLIAEGGSTKEIAAVLGVSVKTVETHRARLMERLDIHDVAGLVRFAIREGLVTPEEWDPPGPGRGSSKATVPARRSHPLYLLSYKELRPTGAGDPRKPVPGEDLHQVRYFLIGVDPESSDTNVTQDRPAARIERVGLPIL